MINVLYINFASQNLDGAVFSLMDLIKSVRNEVNPIVMLRSKGCVYDYFCEEGIECALCDFEEDLVGIPRKWHQYVRYVIKYLPHHFRYKRKNRQCVETMTALMRNKNIQIVHINNTVMSVGLEISSALGAKCVWHLRGFMDLDFGWRPLRGWRVYKKDLEKADAVIGITKTVLYHFIPLNTPQGFIISDAVRSKNDATLIKEKEKYFLFCSAFLTKNKGVDFAVKAFMKSGLSAEGYILKIIGKGEDKFAMGLKKYVNDSGFSQSIEFIGMTDNVKPYMERATAFLMCSANEGLGRVSIEAMFYGCLVIGRNSGGTKDFIFDNETGYLFDDIEGCVKAMKKVTEQDNGRIIAKAQQYACENFSRENYGKKIMNIYNSILDK